MAEGTVEERVIKVFADFKKISPDDIKPETTFEEMGLDSLDGLNLIFELEEEFDITVPDDKVQEMKSIKEVVDGVQYLIDNPYDASAEAQKMMERELAARKAATGETAETPETAETVETPETAETAETVETAEAEAPAEADKPADGEKPAGS